MRVLINASDGGSGVTYKQDDEVCKVTRHGNRYVAVDGWECDPGQDLECGEIEDDDGSNSNSAVYTGKCGPVACTGKADPDKSHPHDSQNTDRVTICHRTCSTNNPWVRITIDKDAWGTTYRGDEDNGTSGCGHKLQHDVFEDCNRDDYSPWAPHYKDYLIMDHGKKDDWDQQHWREWEPACPSVRNDHHNGCCDPTKEWDRGDGVMVSNCCGVFVDPPTTSKSSPGDDGVCALPDDFSSWSLITKLDATVEAHNVYTGVAVGGQFKKYSGGSSVVDGSAHMKSCMPGDLKVNWNGGYSTGDNLEDYIDWARYEWLAQMAVDSEVNGHKVVVKTHGGTFDTFDFQPGGQGDVSSIFCYAFAYNHICFLTRYFL